MRSSCGSYKSLAPAEATGVFFSLQKLWSRCTVFANISSADVVDSNLPELDVSDSNTKEGWRQEGSILYISVLAGNEVQFNLTEDVEYDILGRTKFFNNKSAALTIAGHSTTDLFPMVKAI